MLEKETDGTGSPETTATHNTATVTPASDLVRFARAANWAADAHRLQRRKGSEAEPYVNHCLEVAELVLSAARPGDVEVAIAALLHDTIEDTTTTEADLVRLFGRRVADLVVAVSDDKTLPKEVRKHLQIVHAPSQPRDARLIKFADKISNLRALVRTPPAGWTPARLADYVAWAKQVIDACGPTDPVLERRFAEAHAEAGRVHPPVEQDMRSAG